MYANSDIHPRTMRKVKSTSRRRCQCGCNQKATYVFLANGCGMGAGCELVARRWVKTGDIGY